MWLTVSYENKADFRYGISTFEFSGTTLANGAETSGVEHLKFDRYIEKRKLEIMSYELTFDGHDPPNGASEKPIRA